MLPTIERKITNMVAHPPILLTNTKDEQHIIIKLFKIYLKVQIPILSNPLLSK